MRNGREVSSGRSWRVGVLVVALVSALGAFPVYARAADLPHVFVMGDSVTVGAGSTILAEAPAEGWAVSIDAVVGRSTAEGASILASMQGQLPSVVVVALGNNDGEIPTLFAQRVDAVMRELAGVRHVVWYTMTPFASWVPAANAELRSALGRWPNLELADWSTLSEATPGALNGVGPHLRAPGAQAFADLLFATLDHLGGGTPVVESLDGSSPRTTASSAVTEAPDAMAVAPGGADLWFATPDGLVLSGRGRRFYGSLRSPPRAPIVGMCATPSGRGYWLVASDGGIFSFGDARFYGSTGALRLNQPIVGMSATRSGRGYWLVASDGGIFSFGDAHFYGSGVTLHAATGAFFIGLAPDAHGYVLGVMTDR